MAVSRNIKDVILGWASRGEENRADAPALVLSRSTVIHTREAATLR